MVSKVKAWVQWEEVAICNDRGRREVHYYVRDGVGRRDLAVVGWEKSARHMGYEVPEKFRRLLLRMGKCTAWFSDLKLRSRREVVDWISLLVSDCTTHHLSPLFDGCLDDEDARPANICLPKDRYSGKMGHDSDEFSWLGSAWVCRKRRKHYKSFCRNGIIIAVHDFVYVTVDDNKRLVAHVEDLYRDLRANNMVTVRWFHKVDEIGIILPPDTNDREICFSLCLQDFNIECIVGLAAVLGLHHFLKFKEGRQKNSSWVPYLCRWQIDNDDVKPFDITQVHGYWNQDLLRFIHSFPLKLKLKIRCGNANMDRNKDSFGPQQSFRKNADSNIDWEDNDGTHIDDGKSKVGLSVGNRFERHGGATTFSTTLTKQMLAEKQQLIAPGCQIELLCQDSGISGCWFRCMVLKRHRNKIKVRYQDVEDADGTGNLEEWVSASSIAATDSLGIRMKGRLKVRPSPLHEGLCSYGIGKVVDAWWHDGWWEGIVLRKDQDGKVHVYFPREQLVSIFGDGDLRPSHDWVENKWSHIKERPDIASMLLSELDFEKHSDCNIFQALPSDDQTELEPCQGRECSAHLDGEGVCQLSGESLFDVRGRNVPDLVKNGLKDCLRWNSKRKRKHIRDFFAKEFQSCKRQQIDSSYISSIKLKVEERNKCSDFVISKSLKVADHENCKCGGDPLFGAPPCSSLVMIR